MYDNTLSPSTAVHFASNTHTHTKTPTNMQGARRAVPAELRLVRGDRIVATYADPGGSTATWHAAQVIRMPRVCANEDAPDGHAYTVNYVQLKWDDETTSSCDLIPENRVAFNAADVGTTTVRATCSTNFAPLWCRLAVPTAVVVAVPTAAVVATAATPPLQQQQQGHRPPPRPPVGRRRKQSTPRRRMF